jgi:Tropinone reductase 1
MAVNLESAFYMTQACHRLLVAAGGGVVIMNSSVAGGPTAMKSGVAYAVSKAGMNQMIKNFACEFAGDGIRVCGVAPWYTATPLARQVGLLTHVVVG